MNVKQEFLYLIVYTQRKKSLSRTQQNFFLNLIFSCFGFQGWLSGWSGICWTTMTTQLWSAAARLTTLRSVVILTGTFTANKVFTFSNTGKRIRRLIPSTAKLFSNRRKEISSSSLIVCWSKMLIFSVRCSIVCTLFLPTVAR